MNGKQLANWRERNGWTQRQASHVLGLDRRTYQNYEGGLPINPHVEAMCMLAESAHTDVEAMPPWQTLHATMRARIAEAKAMPKPGRPRGDTYTQALVKLHKATKMAAPVIRELKSVAPDFYRLVVIQNLISRINDADDAEPAEESAN